MTGELLPRMLQPAYRDWVNMPCEMLGFWLWTGPDGVRDQIARTGANTTSMHLPMRIVKDDQSPLGARPMSPVEQVGPSPSEWLKKLGADAGVGIGEHNNAFFVRYPEWFWEKHPEAAMRDADGEVIRGAGNLWPAVGDPTVTRLSRTQMEEMARALRDEPHVRYWVLGGEEGYPDYFGLPRGDFRPEARKHYEAWSGIHGVGAEPGKDSAAWCTFRESALVSYYAGDSASLRASDESRPVLIPTHGNPFALDLRSKLAYPVADLAGAADGFEAGPISIDGDAERLVRLTLDQQSSFGVPVAAPRLANKQLDKSAVGGGRSFTPESLRRTVYEALGLGAWHVGLVQWSGTLPDGEWGISGTPAESECKLVFSEIRSAASYLKGCSRIRPQVGLWISDETWKQSWQDRWTLFYDLAAKRGWQVLPLTDAQLDGPLARTTPVVVSIDNAAVSPKAMAGLAAYSKAGGSVFAVGALATGGKPPQIVRVADDSKAPRVAISHQTQTTNGANTWSARVKPLPMEDLQRAISAKADLVPVRTPEGVETLCLTDGTNVLAVLINRTPRAQQFHVQLSKQLEARMGRWNARNAVTGELLPERLVEVAPQGTALVCIEPVVEEKRVGEEITRAEAAIGRWAKAGADVGYLRKVASGAVEHRRSGRIAKAYAAARSATNSLVLCPEIACDKAGLRVVVRVLGPDGRNVSGAFVRMRLVPGPFEWVELKETTPGRYELSVPQGKLPRFYDFLTSSFEPVQGRSEVVLDASWHSLEGGTRRCVSLRDCD